MDRIELRDRIAALPFIDDAPRFTWRFRRKRLRERILRRLNDIPKFMEWPTVEEALHVGWNDTSRVAYTHIHPYMLPHISVPELGGASRNWPESTTGTMVMQAAYLSILEQEIGDGLDFNNSIQVIHEFGGGYGAMALLCRRLGFTGSYTIEDLPEIALLRNYYLSQLGVHNIASTNSRNIDECDLYIALFSISETPVETRHIPHSRHYLIGYNPSMVRWDNANFFDRWKSHMPNHWWSDFISPFDSNHRILIGIA